MRKIVLILVIFLSNVCFSQEIDIKKLEKECNKKDGRACYLIANEYDDSNGEKHSYDKATPYYQKSCDFGFAMGCYNLGVMYDYGKGIEKDFVKATNSYMKACDNGDIGGCFAVARRYEFGKGISKNIEKAKEYYKLGCDLRSEISCEEYKRVVKGY